MIKITYKLFDKVSSEAKASPRLRKNYNFHKDLNEPVQRLLNVIEPGTYIRPHKHGNPDKTELFITLRGRAVAVQFDEAGNILDHIVMGRGEDGVGVEFPPGTWHTFLALEPGTVLFEVKEGPYIVNTDKNFASWAPPEGSQDVPGFLDKILSELKLTAVRR